MVIYDHWSHITPCGSCRSPRHETPLHAMCPMNTEVWLITQSESMHGTKIALYRAVRGKFIEPYAPSSELCVITGTGPLGPNRRKPCAGERAPGTAAGFTTPKKARVKEELQPWETRAARKARIRARNRAIKNKSRETRTKPTSSRRADCCRNRFVSRD